jgi:hypothetical protein
MRKLINTSKGTLHRMPTIFEILYIVREEFETIRIEVE